MTEARELGDGRRRIRPGKSMKMSAAPHVPASSLICEICAICGFIGREELQELQDKGTQESEFRS